MFFKYVYYHERGEKIFSLKEKIPNFFKIYIFISILMFLLIIFFLNNVEYTRSNKFAGKYSYIGNSLIGKIYIPANVDIKSLKKGQKIEMMVDRYPYKKFGVFTGTINRIKNIPLQVDNIIEKLYKIPFPYYYEVIIKLDERTDRLHENFSFHAILNFETKNLMQWIIDSLAIKIN